jgi:tetratricopeptide (TPR) repeat protein
MTQDSTRGRSSRSIASRLSSRRISVTSTGSEQSTVSLSIVVVAYNMGRELPRTLRSLSVGYQRDVTAEDYEVIVVDNGSTSPVDPSVFAGLAGQFRLLRIDDAPASPAHAVNLGLQEARGQTIGVMVDGARLASPGLVHYALVGSCVYARAGIVTLGWYVGYDFQRYALEAGWTRADEDQLLDTIGWPNDGYRLFEISTMDESSVGGWFHAIVESNALFLPTSAWDELGGYDERFDSPGGGLVNYDTLRRASELDGLGWVVLLGEATFHQLHGGIATNVTPTQIDEAMKQWTKEYGIIRRRDVELFTLPDPVHLGPVPKALQPHLAHALTTALHTEGLLDAPVPPPVPMPDPAAEREPLAAQWMEKAATAARQGLDIEALKFARRARTAAPTASGIKPLLACIVGQGMLDDLPPARRAQFHVDTGEVYERVGSLEQAEEQFERALAVEPGNNAAYLGLSRIRMPGPFYYEVLQRLHEELKPATYLEIGVAEGVSLSLARPPTVAVAVDPAPAIRHPISVECRLYLETSTDFFEGHDVRTLFEGQGPSIAFIDGLHEYAAALEDFWHVEAIADPNTIVVLHDMIPFDEVTQRPERVHNFYTGDVWKLLHCLADVRPDLSWFTVRTPPSGLTFVTGLDPTSTVLRDHYPELVERYGQLSFAEGVVPPGLVIDNDWSLVAHRLDQRRSVKGSSGTPPSDREPLEGEVTRSSSSVQGVGPLTDDRPRVDVLRRDESEFQAPAERGEVQLRISQLRDSRLALDRAKAELEAMRRTRLFRWSKPLRGVYGRLRHRGNVA